MSEAAKYLAIRGHRIRNCYSCDRNPCKCDRVTVRAVKRGAKQIIRAEIEVAAMDCAEEDPC